MASNLTEIVVQRKKDEVDGDLRDPRLERLRGKEQNEEDSSKGTGFLLTLVTGNPAVTSMRQTAMRAEFFDRY